MKESVSHETQLCQHSQEETELQKQQDLSSETYVPVFIYGHQAAERHDFSKVGRNVT